MRSGCRGSESRSIQRRIWLVSFLSAEHKSCALEINSITVCGCEVFLGDAEHQTVLVKVFEAPDEMPDTLTVLLADRR